MEMRPYFLKHPAQTTENVALYRLLYNVVLQVRLLILLEMDLKLADSFIF